MGLSPGRQGFQPLVLPGFRIQRKQVMLQAVGNPYIGNTGGHIVTQCLFSHGLGNAHFGSLALYEQPKTACLSGCRYIGAPGQSVDQQRFFHPDQPGRNTVMCTQPVDNVLPYPFLRGKADIFFSDCVENIVFLPVSLESVFERRKVKRREQPQL